MKFLTNKNLEGRRVHKNFYVIISLLFILHIDIFALQKGVATAVGLNFYPSAEAAAMGNSFVTIGDSVESVYYNPAGVSDIENISFMVNYTQWIFNMYHTAIAVVYPFKDNKITANMQYFYIGETEEIESPLQFLPHRVTLYDMLVGIGYSRKILFNTAAGIQVKNFTQNYGSKYNVSTLVLDMGVKVKFGSFLAGAGVTNIGSSVKINNVENKLPLNIKFGIGYKKEKFKIGLDVNLLSDSGTKVNFGGEYQIKDIKLRAGYTQVDKINFVQGISLGVGYDTAYKMDKFSPVAENKVIISFNYAFSYLGEELGMVHRIGIGGKF